MGSVISLGKRLNALEAKAPQSPWDLDCLPDAELEQLAGVIESFEALGRDADALDERDFQFLLSVQERCWRGASA